jgi:putative endopeptidase
MDRSVSPGRDFYQYATGAWIKRNPVPAEKSRWGAFEELNEYNFSRLRRLIRQPVRREGRLSRVAREVVDFYNSARDVPERNRRKFAPLIPALRQIESIRSIKELGPLLAGLHAKGVSALFEPMVYPDKKRSRFYGLYLFQGGLSLPDREYYLATSFKSQRAAFRQHIIRSLSRLGDSAAAARRAASVIVGIETELAKASRNRTDLRDQLKNYNRTPLRQLRALVPAFDWKSYFARHGVQRLPYVIVGQPEFFRTVNKVLRRRPLSDWKTYLRWHLLRTSAPYLHQEIEDENFRFFHRTLLGQKEPEPAWKRAVRTADRVIGDALGQLFVDAYFPPAAAARMKELVADLRQVFADRLRTLEWMTSTTRRRALKKFARFRAKIGHPRRFRDDSELRIDPRDYLGNIWRALEHETHRKMVKVGRSVDPEDWQMTAPQVNAYFDATQNEIVFPAGILQPPFFDETMDDPVNYGGIGLVIGHEITHGYDDQGRRYDERGNLRDWWTAADAREFQRRAKKVVAEYDQFEPLPGVHIKGALTQGENIADLGGLSIAFEALQRRLRRNPAARRKIDGLTPEQRFFVSYGQIWRETVRSQEARRRLTIDSHSPGRFRVIGALVNSKPFFDAFGIRRGDPMFRAESQRVRIW